MMDSSFLTWVNVGLGLYSGISFLKLLVQFGLPNHPAKFTSYLVSFCVALFLILKALTGLGFISPLHFLRWQAFPLVAGSLALLLQVVMTVGHFSLIQQKVVSRLPLIAALLVFAFFPGHAGWFVTGSLGASTLFLSISVGKARYQKRMFFKMIFFMLIFGICSRLDLYSLYVVGELFLFGALFYFFIFQQTFGISAIVEDYQSSREGALR